MKKRKKYSKEFKLDDIALVVGLKNLTIMMGWL